MTRDSITDRFIPAAASREAYRAAPPATTDASLLDLRQTSVREGEGLMDSPSPPRRDAIAQALSFNPCRRVYSFGVAGGSSTGSSAASPMSSSSSPAGTPATPTTPISLTTPHPQTLVHFRVLDAPCLKNDFYANLVAWSSKTGTVAVGLASSVFLWMGDSAALLLELPPNEPISAVSFSYGSTIVIGTKPGRLFLFEQESRALLDQYHPSIGHGICCIAWFPNSSTRFLVGDETGEVHYFEMNPSTGELQMKSQFKSNQQQVCGIAINQTGDQVTIGGNDNCCTIWDIKDVLNPKLKHFLPHQAAVKAIAYCPWSKSLIATGGGCKDRTIRFWHSQTGTLLHSYQTKGQITSLIWSQHKKQLLATFGFSDIQFPCLIMAFSYPKMQPVIQVDATPNLRILTAVSSPDNSSICVTTNDETVRFYKLWDPTNSVIIDSQEDGVFGSELIELSEGITKTGHHIR